MDRATAHGLPSFDMSSAQRRLLAVQRRFGTMATVALVTAVSVVGSVAATTAATWIADGFADTRYFLISLVIAVAVPLVVAPSAMTLVVSLVTRLGEANERLVTIATTDELTGLRNRRGFFGAAEVLLDGGRPAEPLVVGMIDLDEFKDLNDRFGHHAGDRALRVVATRIVDAVCSDGLVGRIGGDEFAFVIAGRPDDLGLRRRLAMACSDIAVGDGATICASVGIAAVDPDDTVDTALGRADAALYREKDRAQRRSGRAAVPGPDLDTSDSVSS